MSVHSQAETNVQLGYIGQPHRLATSGVLKADLITFNSVFIIRKSQFVCSLALIRHSRGGARRLERHQILGTAGVWGRLRGGAYYDYEGKFALYGRGVEPMRPGSRGGGDDNAGLGGKVRRFSREHDHQHRRYQIHGDVGLYPGTSVTGFGSVKLYGTEYVNDAVAKQAQADALTAYNDLAGLPSTENLTGMNLGGLTLTAGVYKFSSSAQLTGKLTLQGPGRFVFQIGSTLITASDSSVIAPNDGVSNVYWQVGSSATLGTGTAFEGTIIADVSDTLDTDATMMRRPSLCSEWRSHAAR